jgi:hypothetical protein
LLLFFFSVFNQHVLFNVVTKPPQHQSPDNTGKSTHNKQTQASIQNTIYRQHLVPIIHHTTVQDKLLSSLKVDV